MKQIILLVTLFGIITKAYSQPGLLWSENFTAGLSYHFTESPSLDVSGDTIKVVGRKNIANGQRLAIVKYDLNGNLLSTKMFGNDLVFNNSIVDYKFDEANNLYILNKEQVDIEKSKIILQKYSLDGSLVWVRQIQNTSSIFYDPASLGLVNDTCIFFTAYKEHVDQWVPTVAQLYAYNSNGNQLWLREFNSSTEIRRFLNDIFIYNNTAFLFAKDGLTNNNRLVKVDIHNNLTKNDSTGLLYNVSNVQLTPDNNLLLTSAYQKYRISKVDLYGVILWTYDYGTNLPSNITADEIITVLQESNGNILLTGRHYGPNYDTPSFTNADILTLKLNNNGNLIWENRYQHLVNNADIGTTLATKNGQVYVGGHSQRQGISTDYDYIVLKIDSASGLSTGIYRYNGIENGNDAVSSLFIFDNGNVALTGLSFINSKHDWTTQLLSEIVLDVPDSILHPTLNLYPNPIKGGNILTIEGNALTAYTIMSTIGQVLQQGSLAAQNQQTILLSNLPKGMYIVSLKTDTETITEKLIVR